MNTIDSLRGGLAANKKSLKNATKREGIFLLKKLQIQEIQDQNLRQEDRNLIQEVQNLAGNKIY